MKESKISTRKKKKKELGVVAIAMIGSTSKEGHSVGIGTPTYMAPE